MVNLPTHFRDANYNSVPYDGSEVQWRVSIYGICIQDDKLLLIKNRDEKYYDIPGGGIELDESLEQALARESKEEAGWELLPVRPVLTLTDYFYHFVEKKFYKSLQMFWLAQGKKIIEKPTDDETEEVLLVRLDQIDQYDIYPNVLTALKKL